MISISNNDFSILSFLVRNFSTKYTIRNISQKLGFSAAGVFSSLKKLEKEDIVLSERLGTGLFYSVNYDNKIARHLAAIALLEGKDKDVEIKEECKALIINKKSLLAIEGEISVEGFTVYNETKESLLEKIRQKDRIILEFFKDGKVQYGEDLIIDILKRGVSRF